MHSICSQLTTKPQGHKNNPASSGHSVKVLQLKDPGYSQPSAARASAGSCSRM
jgi:hypothetical protein